MEVRSCNVPTLSVVLHHHTPPVSLAVTVTVRQSQGRFTCFEREDRSRLGPRQLEWLSLPLKSTLPSDKTWAYMSEAPHR